MTTPATRTPVRIARGTYSDLNASITDILDGEICWATDEDKIYVKDSGSLVATMLTSADVGVTVQGYDATILKSADIGVSVQGYDVDTAKLDVAQTFTEAQTFNSDLTINSQRSLRFADADSSNYVGLQAPAIVSSNISWTLPSSDGNPGQALGTNGAGALAFITPSASLNVAVKSANYTAIGEDKGKLFTVTGSWTLSLTAAATLGDGWYIFLKNTGTGQITVDPSGSELIGEVASATCNQGDCWLIVCDGTKFILNRLEGRNYSFITNSTTFTVPAGVYRVFVEVQGGGGGGGYSGGSYSIGCGGSAGGYASKWVPVTPGESITVTIGSAGAGASSSGGTGSSGGTTTFVSASSNISGYGGTGGFGNNNSPHYWARQGGTSGGGDISQQGGFSSLHLASSTGKYISAGGSSRFGTGGFYTFEGSTTNTGYTASPGLGAGGATKYNTTGQTGGVGCVLIQWI